ncbi:uncharacterized protein LOC100369898 [Saccoglossus kowalevskii]
MSQKHFTSSTRIAGTVEAKVTTLPTTHIQGAQMSTREAIISTDAASTVKAQITTEQTTHFQETQETITSTDAASTVDVRATTEPTTTIQDVAATSLTITTPSPGTAYIVNTETQLTAIIGLSSTNGGVEVTSVKGYFADPTSSTISNIVDATGASSAAAGATEITDTTISLTLDAGHCANYSRVCIVLQTDPSPDGDTSNNEACTDITTICTDVAATSLVITTPASGTAYIVNREIQIFVIIELHQKNGGAEVTGVQGYFADMTSSKLSTMVDATGPYPVAAGETKISSTKFTLSLDAIQCASYSRVCIALQIDPSTDDDTSNNEACTDITTICTDCDAFGRESGVYQIQPTGVSQPLEVWCDITDSDVWTVIQHRQDGSFNFDVEWEEYKHGFGNIDGEYWIGNDNIYHLTNQSSYKLRIDLEKFDGETAYAEYEVFWIDDENNNYALHCEGYAGTAGDGMMYHNGQQFSTPDIDNDNDGSHCASEMHGGWWFDTCEELHYLNGIYYQQQEAHLDGIVWFTWNDMKTLKSSTIKIQNIS